MSKVSDNNHYTEALLRQPHSIAGIIRQIDYQGRRIALWVDGRHWDGIVAANCRFWIENRRASFRCYRPHDCVRILYGTFTDKNLVEEIYMDEPGDGKATHPLR